jgi:hypothetical protein
MLFLLNVGKLLKLYYQPTLHKRPVRERNGTRTKVQTVEVSSRCATFWTQSNGLKVKLFPCLTKHYAMETYGGSGRVEPPFLYLCTSWRLASPPGHFTLGKRSWLGSGTGLDDTETNVLSYQDSKCDRLLAQPLSRRYTRSTPAPEGNCLPNKNPFRSQGHIVKICCVRHYVQCFCVASKT